MRPCFDIKQTAPTNLYFFLWLTGPTPIGRFKLRFQYIPAVMIRDELIRTRKMITFGAVAEGTRSQLSEPFCSS